MELEGELGGYDFVCRVRFGNRHAIADRGILVRQQIPQNREIYQFQIHKELFAKVLKTGMTNLESLMPLAQRIGRSQLAADVSFKVLLAKAAIFWARRIRRQQLRHVHRHVTWSYARLGS